MSNSREFMDIFNKLERYLKEQIEDGSRKPFYSLISTLRHSNSNIRYYYVKLKEYADLRNAIVHERIDGRVIAEPNEYAIRELQMIYDKISKSPKVIEICAHPVKSLSLDDKLSLALSLMNKSGISQIPIYDEKTFVGMLNSISISNWMASVMGEGSIDISKVLVREVLSFSRKSRVTLFKSDDIDVYEILDVYKAYSMLPERIDAIIITKTGDKSEEPITIVTDHDILRISESV